jgi:pilus assembly protein FimV
MGAPLYGLLGIAGLLAAYAAYRARQKKQPKFDSSIMGDSSMQANSMFGSTGGQSVDTNNSVFNSNFAPSASQLDTNEVDPVAEADVYIAYGRDVQAEEILKEALRTQPERNAVRLKLLEIYASRKDTRSFEMQAGELYSITHGDGDDWALAASMGMTIDPNNPLYAGGELSDDAAAMGTPVLHAATEPLDDLDPEAMLVSTQQPHPKEENPFDFDAPVMPEAPQSNALDLDLSATAAPLVEEEFDFNLDELAAAAPAAVASVPAAEPVEDEHVLDFDLGGLSFEPVTPKVAATPAPMPVMEPVPELSLDKNSALSLDKPMVPMVSDLPVEESFDMQFDVPGGKTADAPYAAHTPAMGSGSDMKLDVDSIDFGLPHIDQGDGGAVPAATHDMAHDAAASDDGFAMPQIADIPDDDKTTFGKPPDVAEAVPTAHDFDLSGIDLDLGSAEPIGDMKADSIEAFAVGEDPSADQMEMDTKLDLAIAYQEIGDKEGARELIDEVIKGGAPEQVEKAKAMRLKLA